MGEQHLEGFGGNVRRFPGHAFIGGDSSSIPRTVLPQIAEANRNAIQQTRPVFGAPFCDVFRPIFGAVFEIAH